MKAEHRPKASPVVALYGVACLAGTFFCVRWLRTITLTPLGQDLRIYYDALLKARAGANPYLPYRIGHSFVYHPFALTFVSLFSWHGRWELAYPAWSCASVAAWVAAILVALRLVARAQGQAALPRGLLLLTIGLLVFFGPFVETVYVGQINAFVVLSLYLSLLLAEDGKNVLAGLMLALAIVLKTSPLLFVGYFLATRRYRVVVSSLASLVALSAIAALQFSPEVLHAFLATVARMGTELFLSTVNEGVAVTLHQALYHLGLGHPDEALLLVQQVACSGLALLLLASGLAIPAGGARQRLYLSSMLLVIMVIESPLVWYHHWVLILLPLALLLVQDLRGSGRFALRLLVLMQLERVFEVVAIYLALPVLLAAFILIGKLLLLYWRDWRPSLPAEGPLARFRGLGQGLDFRP